MNDIDSKTKGNLKNENINIRVSPKTKFLLEILARKQHRTFTSIVEWALEKAILDNSSGITNYRDLLDLWDPHPCIRFIKIAFFDKSLLNYEEDLIWSLICTNGLFWNGDVQQDEYCWNCGKSENLLVQRVLYNFELLKLIAANLKTVNDIEGWLPYYRCSDSNYFASSKEYKILKKSYNMYDDKI